MALGSLNILYMILIVLAIIGTVMIYIKKGNDITGNGIFSAVSLLGLIISWFNYTALPSNYTGSRIIALGWGILSLIAVIIKFTSKDKGSIARFVLTISVLGGLINLIFF